MLRRKKRKNSCEPNLADDASPPEPSVAVLVALSGTHRKRPLDNQAPEKSRPESENSPK
jgi:hypothetical protein